MQRTRNQRMKLDRKSAKFQDKAECDDRATWNNPCGVFSSFMFCQGVCRCLYQTWVIESTPLFFSAQGGDESVERKYRMKHRRCWMPQRRSFGTGRLAIREKNRVRTQNPYANLKHPARMCYVDKMMKCSVGWVLEGMQVIQ